MRRCRVTLVVVVLLPLVVACGQVDPGGSTPPREGTPNEGPTVSGVISDWGGGTGTIEVRDRGPFFFRTGGGIVTTVATSEIADDGSFAVSLPEVPAGAFTLVEPDTVSIFGCDASGLTVEPLGEELLVAHFETGAGGMLAHGVQQGASTLFVTPVVGDLQVFYVYADGAVRVQGSELCPAVQFLLEYDLELDRGWNTFNITFVSQMGARAYDITSAEPPTEAVWYISGEGP